MWGLLALEGAGGCLDCGGRSLPWWRESLSRTTRSWSRAMPATPPARCGRPSPECCVSMRQSGITCCGWHGRGPRGVGLLRDSRGSVRSWCSCWRPWRVCRLTCWGGGWTCWGGTGWRAPCCSTSLPGPAVSAIWRGWCSWSRRRVTFSPSGRARLERPSDICGWTPDGGPTTVSFLSSSGSCL